MLDPSAVDVLDVQAIRERRSDGPDARVVDRDEATARLPAVEVGPADRSGVPGRPVDAARVDGGVIKPSRAVGAGGCRASRRPCRRGWRADRGRCLAAESSAARPVDVLGVDRDATEAGANVDEVRIHAGAVEVGAADRAGGALSSPSRRMPRRAGARTRGREQRREQWARRPRVGNRRLRSPRLLRQSHVLSPSPLAPSLPQSAHAATRGRSGSCFRGDCASPPGRSSTRFGRPPVLMPAHAWRGRSPNVRLETCRLARRGCRRTESDRPSGASRGGLTRR